MLGRVLLLDIPDRDRVLTRSAMLLAGLVLYGASSALLVLAGLGLGPWDVFHQGLARSLGGQVGTWSILVGALVLLAWIPLRQRPGIGTVANVVLVGLTINATLAVVPPPEGLALQVTVMLAGVVLNGVATGLYIGAGLGPGPRDGLMTGLAARGHSIRVVRTGIEVTVLAAGWLLGGSVGVGTVVYALAIGPLTQAFLPVFTVRYRHPDAAPRLPDPDPSARPAPVHP
jgi:uncharacterized membrane protein YczE